MIEKLPYTLSKGVVARREGLVMDSRDWRYVPLVDLDYTAVGAVTTIPWSGVAKRLQRRGEPYCYVADGYDDSLVCERAMYDTVARPLHRLAAILCDDAEAFRVLHWCVENLCVAPVRQEAGDE